MLKRYRVTETAPSRLNGRRVEVDQILDLPEAVALYDRDLGYLVEEPAEGAEAPLAEPAEPGL